MSFIEIFTQLCSRKGVSPNEACKNCGLSNSTYSYWKSKNAVPHGTTLVKLAQYFNVTPEFLSGDDGEYITSKAMGEVVEWLTDNEYEVDEDDTGTYTIGKDGKYVYFSNGDFVNESLAIKTIAEDGFELSMCDWVRRQFPEHSDTTVDEYEQGLLDLLRNLDPMDKISVIGEVVKLCKDIEKKNERKDTKNVG